MLRCSKGARSWQREYLRELLANLRQRPRAVDDPAPLRIGGSACEIGCAHALEKFRLLPLEFVQRTAVREPLPADPDWNIENKRQVRAKIIERHALHVGDPCHRNAMTAALVSVRRIGETVAQHPSALREPGPDLALAMLATRREHQQCFGDMGHGLAKQKLAKPLAQRCPARLAGDPHLPAGLREKLREPRQMGTLAGAVDAFKGDQAATERCGHRKQSGSEGGTFRRRRQIMNGISGHCADILPRRDCGPRGWSRIRSTRRPGRRNKETATLADEGRRRSRPGSATRWASAAILLAYRC